MKQRFRIKARLFHAPLIVLQIEDTRHGCDPLTFDSWTSNFWRDARPDDLDVKVRR